jgi:hypothetical protein
MTALRAVPDQAMDGAGLQERQLSQLEDDGFTRNQDLVARILKVLDGCQIELPSKEKHTRRLNQDEGQRGRWRASRPLVERATGLACADGPDDVGAPSVRLRA